MKKILLLVSLILVLFVEQSHAFEFVVVEKGFGITTSLVLPEEIYRSINDVVAIGFGMHGVVGISLGKLGQLYYYPNVAFWASKDEYYTQNTEHWKDHLETHGAQISINWLDFKYRVPVPQNLVVKPYAGLGAFGVVIDRQKAIYREYDNNDELDDTHYYNRNKIRISANLIAGLDFDISPKINPFIEVKFTATAEWAFRFSGGLTLKF